ncbi:MAG: c-type cytochrome, partial [Planctomycetota bacterium]
MSSFECRLIICVLMAFLGMRNALADDGSSLNLPAGFEGERIYNVPNRQGSWVSMTVDPQGRLIVSDQYGGLYRVTVSGDQPIVEPVPVKVGFAQGLLCAFDSLYVVSHAAKFDVVNANGMRQKIQRPAGLYRVRDTNNDDQYDSLELLRAFQGGGEHGPHAVILGPDKESLYLCAGNHTKLPSPEKSRVPQVWQEDQLTPRLPDAGGHAVGIMAPGGWICKTDPDGKAFELLSIGFRNQYDIAFSSEGELFTFDADMEWDIGLPWYRPTRVCHVTSGSEFGWRNGSGKWPVYFPDSVPPVVDIGPGSPTGITFGRGSKFPSAYQDSLFIADWSYGIIYRVTLEPDGATYRGEKTTFCTAPVLPVTDMVINEADGAMYFLTGGRRSQSALYRIRYTGELKTSPGKVATELNGQLELRRKLDRMHRSSSEVDLELVWKCLSHEDRAIRFAARTALELTGNRSWKDRALAESEVQTKLESLMALARTGEGIGLQERVIGSLLVLPFDKLTEIQKLHLLRNLGLALMRLGQPNANTLRQIQNLSRFYPAESDLVNRELSRLMAAVEPDDFVEKTITLLRESKSQKQQIHYAVVLHGVKSGWTTKLREEFLKWFVETGQYAGGSSFRKYLTDIRNRFAGEMPPQERQKLQLLFRQPIEPVDPYTGLASRKLVKNWTLEDLQDVSLEGRDIDNGKKMFAVTQCSKCHVIQGEGGIVGPDLTNAGRRFSQRDLIETIVDPNKEVSDQYQATTFLLDDGRVISGRIAN